MDVATLQAALIGSRKRAANGVVYIGDSLLANGSTNGSNTGQYVGTVNTGTAIGATTLIVDYPYTVANGYTNVSPPGTGAAYALEPGTTREEWFVPSAVSGTGPYTLTVPALTYAHAAGVAVRNDARQWAAQSIPLWVTLLSNNRMRFAGLFAHGGYTTAQIKNIYLPQILAMTPTPGAAILCVGTNDNYDLVTALPLAVSIVDALIAKGILPIVVGVPPSGGAPVASAVVTHVKWNHALGAACQRRGVPFVDSFASLADDGSGVAGSGSYKTTYNKDNTHPSEIGAKIWAQAIVTAALNYFPYYTDTLTSSVNALSDGTVYPCNVTNVLLLTDTNADGIPDGWSKSAGNAGDTNALVSESGVPGKMFSITRAAAGTTDPIYAGSLGTLTTGHKYRVFLRVKTSGLDAAYDALKTTTGTGGGNTTSTFQGIDIRVLTTEQLDTLFCLKTWSRDIPLSLISFDFTLPAGLTQTSPNITVRLRGSASTPAFTVEVQPFIVDLTALGIT